MLLSNEVAGLILPCGNESIKPDECPANIDLMFLTMAQYPRVEHATWIVAALLGYFADSDGVVAARFLPLLDKMATRLDIVVANEISQLVYSGWLRQLSGDTGQIAAYQVSPEWIAKAKVAPPLPPAEDDDEMLNDEELDLLDLAEQKT
jgi:hypothetical protein